MLLVSILSPIIFELIELNLVVFDTNDARLTLASFWFCRRERRYIVTMATNNRTLARASAPAAITADLMYIGTSAEASSTACISLADGRSTSESNKGNSA
ncbi:hypothetical protein NP493_369g05027 [Ridgeia piscesae]|uniref:Uncharacterized protein n=1 Tax=Ridgeia piscesae TaxID=27915 RepID=A0AAD9L298_RIDPI|nr:hypothetical protein NP493_369g05027 [Ridgeia piscesae]